MPFTFRWRLLIVALMDAWPSWLGIVGVLFAAGVGFGLSRTASAGVRYAGTTLQLLGVGTVAAGLSQVRRTFGRPSLFDKAIFWLRQLGEVFRRPKPVSVVTTAAGSAIVGGQARIVVNAGAGAPLERRVAILEQNLDRLRDEVDANDTKIRNELTALKGVVEQEARIRETEARRLTAQMEDLAVGGLHLEMVGLMWLVLGVLGTSVPDEIARLLTAFRPAV